MWALQPTIGGTTPISPSISSHRTSEALASVLSASWSSWPKQPRQPPRRPNSPKSYMSCFMYIPFSAIINWIQSNFGRLGRPSGGEGMVHLIKRLSTENVKYTTYITYCDYAKSLTKPEKIRSMTWDEKEITCEECYNFRALEILSRIYDKRK